MSIFKMFFGMPDITIENGGNDAFFLVNTRKDLDHNLVNRIKMLEGVKCFVNINRYEYKVYVGKLFTKEEVLSTVFNFF